MAEITVYPNADLAGVWQLSSPLPVDGSGYVLPTLVASDSAGYLAEDGASPALVEGELTVGTVAVDDVAVLVVAVTDATETAELTSGEAPFVRGQDEVQEILSYLTAGTFTLEFDGETTGAIAFDADNATILAALEALSNVAPGDVVVAGGPIDGFYPVEFTFSGAYAETDVPALVPSIPYVAPVNEVQTITSDRTGGTFTLTYGGSTTSSINWNATAATIQTALIALPNLDPGDVVCSGGPINSAPVVVTFGGSLAATDVGAITVTDSGTGGTGIGVVETTPGVEETGIEVSVTQEAVASRPFDLAGSFNIPRAGAAYEPQAHVWTLPMVVADSGRFVDFEVADAGGQHSWVAALSVWRGLDTTTPVDVALVEEVGSGTTATFDSVTPVTEGAVALAFVSKAAGAGYVDPEAVGAPLGYTSAVSGVSDAMTLDLFVSGGLPSDPHTAPVAAWSVAEQWLSGVIVLRPATGAGAGLSLYQSVDAVDESSWIELASAAGSMFEVLELDLATVPAGAVILGARFELAHDSTVRNRLRAVVVGINADDSIVEGSEQQLGYIPLPVGLTKVQESAMWYELSDGSPVSDFDRLGVALFSSDRHPALSTHRVFWVRAVVEYEPGGPVVSGVAGPTDPGDPIVWTYSSTSGLAQTHYQVMVVAGSAQDPDTATDAANVLDAAAGEIVYDSGRLAGQLVRSLVLADAPLGRGVHTVAVRAWARLATGQSVASDWDTADFDITGSPVSPGASATDPVFDESSGGVDVSVSVPAAVTRAWLVRSVDGGVSWTLVEGGPFTVTPSTVEVLTDYRAPLQAAALRYEVSFDAGAMTETSAPITVGTTADIATPAGQWYLLCPDLPELNTAIDVKEVGVQVPVRTVTAEQPGNSVTASSLPLAARITLQLWIRDGDERAAVEAVLESGRLLRLVNIWGQEWQVRNVSGLDDDPQRWAPRLGIDPAGLRDAHIFGVELLEELGA